MPPIKPDLGALTCPAAPSTLHRRRATRQQRIISIFSFQAKTSVPDGDTLHLLFPLHHVTLVSVSVAPHYA